MRPLLPQNVQAAYAKEGARKLETSNAEIYYPASQKAAAERIAARMSGCLDALRQKAKSRATRSKALVYLTDANFNNAYVTGRVLGDPLHTVNPVNLTAELFSWLNMGLVDVGDIACHELAHYVQMEQIEGLWGGVYSITGDLLPIQIFTEAWFLEGLAQYYEGRLGQAVGRPHSALYRAMFESVVATRGELHAGDLNLHHRQHLPLSGAYQTGFPFVEWLAQTYGEDKLWELVDVQGHSWASPLMVTLRFQRVYGLDIGDLFERFAAHAKSKHPPRQRPASQRVLVDNAGFIARIAASAADGAVARIAAGHDEPVSLTVHERDGSTRFSVPLTRFAPGRPWVVADPFTVSGMSFTADGRWLYLMNDDVTADGSQATQLWRVDARTGGVSVLLEGLRAVGGGISPDGARYVFVEISGDVTRLVEIELATGERRALASFEPGWTAQAPAYAPDGRRIAFALRSTVQFDLWLREADGKLVQLTADDRFDYAPKWLDDGRLLFAREHDGRIQAHVYELASRTFRPVSSAPYAVIDPVPIGFGDFAFLNRHAWYWTIDATSISDGPSTTVAEAPPPAAEPDSPAEIVADSPYSPTEGLFFPTLHAPWILAAPLDEKGNAWATTAGISLLGQDRLAFHRWALNAGYTFPTGDHSVSAEYGNYQLAPWFGALRLARDRSTSPADKSEIVHHTGSLSFGRTFWTTPVSFSFVGIERLDSAGRTRLFGPGFAFDYAATESTPYGGISRALAFSGGLRLFAKGLGSSLSLLDARAVISGAPHVPGLRRDTLFLSATGRSLRGAPEGLLQVGGIPRGAAFFFGRSGAEEPAAGPELPQLLFAESVRGYDDFAVRATSAAVLEAEYGYAFPIDYGWASTLFVLPSLFIRGVDVQVFGSAAFTDNPSAPQMTAAGAAVFLRMAMMQSVPLSLYYQLAARFDFGLGPLHVVGLSVE